MSLRVTIASLPILLLSCSSSDTAPLTDSTDTPPSISQTQANRSGTAIYRIQPDLINQSIQVQGTVQQLVPLLNKWLYEISDDTGTIWVITPETPPVLGQSVVVEGNVQYEQILIGGIDQGDYYLLESRRQPLGRVIN